MNITGYAVLEFGAGEPAIVEAGTIRTSDKADLAERISLIHADLSAILAELKPDTAAIEQLYAHYKHPRTAILMAHAGVIMLACHAAGIAVHNLPSTHVKKSLTGNGHAGKQQMQRAIQAVCRLKELPQPPDVADAIAIALCAGRKAFSTDYTEKH